MVHKIFCMKSYTKECKITQLDSLAYLANTNRIGYAALLVDYMPLILEFIARYVLSPKE